jgi:hypothetical protein
MVEGVASSRESDGEKAASSMFLVGQAGKAGSTLGPCRSRNLDHCCHQGVCSR